MISVHLLDGTHMARKFQIGKVEIHTERKWKVLWDIYPISDQKRQILISNAFKKLYNTESLSQDQAVEIRLNNSNFDNSSPPTT